MNDQVIILTGAGGGIGRATAVELCRRGATVVLVGRTRSSLDETAALCDARGVVRCADVTDSPAVTRLIDSVVADFGRLDGLVNNAGVAPLRPITETTDELWRQTIDTNLSAAFYLCRAAWPVFAQQRRGVVVNLSSESARDPFLGFSAYGAAKAGLNTLTIALAAEGKPHGIRVHGVAPGAVETPLLRSIVSAEQFPTDQTLDPADVARVIADCINGPLRHTSGETIYLNRADA